MLLLCWMMRRFKGSPSAVTRSVTDAYLLRPAMKHHGKLAAFEGTTPLRAFVRARSGHLTLLT
jgi:hypothetical protein